MIYRSPLSSLNEALNASHTAYKTIASDILGIEPIELDRLIASSLTAIGACSSAGWYIGYMISGESGAAVGAAIGACLGLVLVIGSVAYKVYLRNSHGKIFLSLQL
jgi:hypothetical protein